MKNEKLTKWLFSSRTPPIKYWREFSGRAHSSSFPPESEWKKVWREYKKLYSCGKAKDFQAAEVYFRVEWKKTMDKNTTSALENKWLKNIKKLFPKFKILEHIKLPETGMHLDIFCPQAMVAFEIQGEQHWQPVEKFGGVVSFAKRQERDARKRNLCARLGIKLIEISESTDILTLQNKYEEVFHFSPAVHSL